MRRLAVGIQVATKVEGDGAAAAVVPEVVRKGLGDAADTADTAAAAAAVVVVDDDEPDVVAARDSRRAVAGSGRCCEYRLFLHCCRYHSLLVTMMTTTTTNASIQLVQLPVLGLPATAATLVDVVVGSSFLVERSQYSDESDESHDSTC